MGINLNYSQTFESSVLISDTFTPINGSPGSVVYQLTRGLNGQPVSAALEINSILGGLLWPRMTSAQRLNLNPYNGLTVYDTTLDQYYAYAAGAWGALGAGGGGSGTVTSISQGANIVLTPNPITTTGTVALSSTLTGITSAVVGNFTIAANSITNANSITINSTGGNVILTPVGGGAVVLSPEMSVITSSILCSTNLTLNPTGNLSFTPSGHVISSTDIEVRSNSALQLNNAGNTFSTKLIAGAATANTTYTLPTSLPSVSGQLMTSTTGGVMSFFSRLLDSGSPNNNLFFGTGSGNTTLTGTNNVGFGEGVLAALTTGSKNYAFSSQGGKLITTGSSSILAGFNAGVALTTGSHHVLLGDSAGAKLVSTNSCIALSTNALTNAILNSDCIAIGNGALAALTSAIGVGNNNLAFGTSSAPLLQQGSNNIFAGQNSAAAAITASESIVIGHASFSTAGAFSDCTIVGNDTTFAASGTATRLTFLGKGSGTNTAAITNSTAIGYNAQVNASNNVILGNAAKVGIGLDTATYTLHLSNVSNDCSIGLANTTNIPSIGGSGCLFYSTGNIPTFRNSGGVVAPAGTVTSVSGTATRISSTGGATPIIDLVNTAVVAGSYTYGSFTVGADGRLTSAANGAAPVLIAGSTMSGALILNADPVNPLGAATKQYVDATAAGFTIKTPCVAGTISNLNATYNNGAAGVGATLTNAGAQAAFSTDGVSPSVNARVLVRSQSSTLENGIYQLSTVGDGSTNWVLTRSTDYDQAAEILPGTFVIVEQGTTLANTGWIETATVTTVGTDPILFSQFGGGGGGAPTSSKYLLQVADPSLPNGQSMGALATGLVKNTTTTGVQSIAVAGTDYYSLNNPTRLLDSSGTTNNVFMAKDAGNTGVSGSNNTAIGSQSGTALSSSSDNSFYGRGAGVNTSTSSTNTFLGALSGQNITVSPSAGNTFVGANSGATLTSALNCTFVGTSSGSQTTATTCVLVGYSSTFGADGLTNATAIGANSIVSVSNAISLGSNALVGINTASPLYTLHIANAQNQAVVYLANTLSTPSTPAGGGVLYVSNGQLLYRGSSGTITVIAAA